MHILHFCPLYQESQTKGASLEDKQSDTKHDLKKTTHPSNKYRLRGLELWKAEYEDKEYENDGDITDCIIRVKN